MKLNIDFINGKTNKSLIKMFIPLLMAMTLTMIYSMVFAFAVYKVSAKQVSVFSSQEVTS